MFKFLNLQPEIFGIDVNDLSLRIVKLKKKRVGFVVSSFNETNIPNGIIEEGVIKNQEAFVKIIKESCGTVKGKKLGTKYVAVSLPEEKSFSQVIQMPKMSSKELESAVPFEAENYIPLAIDKVYLDFEQIDCHDGKNITNHVDLLINVMPKSIVDSYVTCFKKAGLIPCVMEVESQSIARALIKNGDGDSPLIIIDFGKTKTSFIIYSCASIRFTCSIPISSEQLTSVISRKLSVSPQKAEMLKVKYGLDKKGEKKYNMKNMLKPILDDLAGQIKKYISFYQSHTSDEHFSPDSKIEKIILCGSGANLKNLPDFLSIQLNIPVEISNPFANINGHKKNGRRSMVSQNPLSFATALGLAIRGANEK